MRLVHLSDLHLGYRQYQRQTATGINQREADVAAVFRGVIDRVIALAPDVVVIAGDVFHNVRPPNPAILHAFAQFSRLTRALPSAIVVMVAGNHDEPRSSDAGCILSLFVELGVHVVHGAAARLLKFPERSLSILAVPDLAARGHGRFVPDAEARYNVLVLHGELRGMYTESALSTERAGAAIDPDDIRASEWTYVALGHHHVFRQLASNMCYSGACEYTSSNIWGEYAEERAAHLPGKVFVEYHLASGKRSVHPVRPARAIVELPTIEGRGRSPAELAEELRRHVARVPNGIEGKIVRQVMLNVPRHVSREVDFQLLRDLRRRALHFELDARKPEAARPSSGMAAPGRRPSLVETVRESLQARPIPSDIDRARLVESGLTYLEEADRRSIGSAASAAAVGGES